MNHRPARGDWPTLSQLATEVERASTAPVPQLLTVADVARLLRVHEKTIRRLVRSHQLPCVRVGASVRFLPTDLTRWLSARREG